MKLEFTEWNAGHHGRKPDALEANDVDHAFKIFSAVACALNQGHSIRAKVEDGQGDVMARFVATDDEDAGADFPEVGDMVCSECGAFWSLCDCSEGGFVPMAAEALEDRDEGDIVDMNAYLQSGEARQPWIDREAFEEMTKFTTPSERGGVIKAD